MPDNDKPSIVAKKNGPYLATRVTTLTGTDGEPIETKSTVALCRCGATQTRPFCDGAHVGSGFTDDKHPDRQADNRDNYAGKTITIHDNRGICSHAGFCSDNLPKVFGGGERGWINPDAATAKRIIEVIDMCPSGALSYSVDGQEHRDQDRPPAIRVTPHGPLGIEGGVALTGADTLEGTSDEHRTLCRCGQSKNKPFCDGAHWHANFRDDGRYRVAMLSELEESQPLNVEVEGIDLVLIRRGDDVVALSGRCRHQGALMADGEIDGDQIVCGLHGWRYDLATGKRDDGSSGLAELTVTIDPRWGEIFVELDEVRALAEAAPDEEAVAVAPSSQNREEPHNAFIRELAEHGLERLGPHGPMAAMGVPRYDLPTWDDIQILTAQLHELPLLEDHEVGTDLVIGPRAKKPLTLDIPIFVSDMSFGALSLEAKLALAKGAELAGTGICSGEGGMLPEEQAANRRYFYELASARFGFSWEQLERVQAFHFKSGQGAKTGTGGHLPGEKVTEKIAAVRGLQPGQAAISPPRFPDWTSNADFERFADQVRERTGGIPIGFKLSAQHVEEDIDAALAAGADYIILDGRGGATGAAPLIFRDNISVPTLPALARARRHLDRTGHGREVTLIITGGLRTPADFAKALALGADGIAVANSAIQAIGCLGTRACHTNNCPAGIATQKEHLRERLNVDREAENLARFLGAAVHLMVALARACGHEHLRDFRLADLTTWKQEVAWLTGVAYGRVGPIA